MSNALAIAAVTAVLKDLLNNTVIDHDLSTPLGQKVKITALPPDRIETGKDEQAQLNLFLYNVSPNQGWRNVGLPARDDQGNRLTNPPLALDLHYLLTAYGQKDFDGEILLGYAMQVLHETPVLPRNAIRTALGTGPPNPGAAPVTGGFLPVSPLVAADLADQVEQIKIVPESLNTEELSKLWAALQAHYRPTAVYHVSVVLIESRRPTKAALPVAQRRILVQPFRQPFITEVTPQIVLAGGSINLRGRDLKAERAKLNFGLEPLSDPTRITDEQIDATLPAGLWAGVNTVQVIQPVIFDTPADPHRGFESNIAPFILAPQITNPQPISVRRGTTLVLAINPPVGRTQLATLFLGDRAIPIPPRAGGQPPTTATLDFPIPADFPTGAFTARVQIDGAQTPLEIDQNPTSPSFGQFTGNPKVTVTV